MTENLNKIYFASFRRIDISQFGIFAVLHDYCTHNFSLIKPKAYLVMSTNNIQPVEGMTVWLKTGGPAMSVKYETVNQEWLCSWFIKDKVEEHAFMAGQLTDQDPFPSIGFPM